MASYHQAANKISSCPSQLGSSFLIMQSRTPESFRFFEKAARSVLVKLRSSVSEMARATVLSSTILEKSNQTLDTLLGLCRDGVFATSEWSEE